jgi:hypothetical protein
MNDSPTRKSPIRYSSSAAAKEQASAFGSVTELGKALARELDRTDILGRWMAHYVAEKISAAESATDNDRAAKEKTAAEAILALWQHRSGLAGDRSPMQAFEGVFSALDRLAEPQDPWSFYRPFPEDAEPGPDDAASNALLRLALKLEDSARHVVRALVS